MPDDYDLKISGLRKSAILMLSLGKDIASDVLGRLDRDQTTERLRALVHLQ